MYLTYDRFEMAILDRLFDRYLEGEAQVVTTYDSINPLQSTREGKDIPLFEFTGTGLSVHDNLVDARWQPWSRFMAIRISSSSSRKRSLAAVTAAA
jgi:hypothetical protein